MLAAESTAAETNAASSFERSPARDQIYQILNLFYFISFKLSNLTWHSHQNVCKFLEKNRMCVNYRNQISKVVYVKKLTYSAPSTWISKRHWMSSKGTRYAPYPSAPPPLPTPSLPLSGKCGIFGQEISEISAQAKISDRRKLLRSKSSDENSSGRSLWKVFLNLFASLFSWFIKKHPIIFYGLLLLFKIL